MAEKTHFIRNCWIEGSGERLVSTDPATGETNWEGRSALNTEVNQAFDAASSAFEPWSDLASEERIRYVEVFKTIVEAHKQELAESISREVGKPLWESNTEVDGIAGKVDLSVEAYNERRCSSRMDFGGAEAVTRFKPHGVVAVFGPFNLPGHLPNGHIVPALIAGNTIVFKPSKQAPLVAQKMVEYWQEAGLPSGVLNLVQGTRETGSLVAQHSSLDGLFFTGSAAAGRMLHKSFGGRPEKILALEMGGNNPLVVWGISDPDVAAYLTVQSAYITSGQRCTCARRLIVPQVKEADRFIESLVSMIGRIRTGPFTDSPEPFMGPVISGEAADDLLKAQENLRTRGGKTIVEMTKMNWAGSFLTPGLMDVTDIEDRPDEEFFGPFLQLIRVPDFEAAIREANSTSYGLAAGLLSENRELYTLFLRRIRAGIVNWNRQITGASGKLPFGGVGGSGNHRPSGFYAADYCSYPVASIEIVRPTSVPSKITGIDTAGKEKK
ncbi:MAG: succinylglutamate-semialdehyde dehydrogenase [Desulfomonile tiedjei]|uniref:Succinylglutamate-semialdehyde dehydrogenase n=1 Tax=Desulfomonile tiedjei TaxID=2358 RepID=A0A9D6Z4Q5_9BACT|nr:succinylglutamate-semialdehyde dehydrogenase [Desulfomonile tiedjei]